MKNAIIIHGWPEADEYFNPLLPSPSNNHWLPWIQHELIIRGWNAQTPEMPDAHTPEYEKWKAVFEGFAIDDQTILIGHSCGAGFLVRWLSESRANVGKVVLVAPFLDPHGELGTGFFDFEIDPELISRTNGVDILYSADDDTAILESVETLGSELPEASFHAYEDKGHFCLDDMGTDEFPELLEIALS